MIFNVEALVAGLCMALGASYEAIAADYEGVQRARFLDAYRKLKRDLIGYDPQLLLPAPRDEALR